ncbi:surfeit locus protein 4 [Echinococcus multilocularis]|uniref:Surfeit locus protein 4 n=1 Tax=Echinococcus multilocularis TaxID=6211 RepID=A0A068YG50_ECHMU|nr:surfeit locus protein 4 [Echinococcus multilocularis]
MVYMFTNPRNREEFLAKLEDVADGVIRRSRRYLPHVARLCLISTFIEDGMRLLTQWSEQIDFIRHVWGVGSFFAGLFIFINILLQFTGSAFVMVRYRVRVGCGILLATVVIQTIGYNIWTRVFLMRNLSLMGSLLLLIAEASQESKSLLAGLPSVGDENRSRQYLQLGGRLLVVLMFLTLVHWGGSFFYLIQSILNLILILLVAIGYKTKLCALILVSWLTCMNFYYNDFWSSYSDEIMWDFLKYDFFQTWSVIGGLMLIVAHGPGGVSVDDYKKEW